MLQEPPLIPNRIFQAGLRPISRPNVNFARSGPPVPITPRATGGPYFHTHGPGRRQIRLTDLEYKVREETLLLTPTPTPTSINWWPYPPWGQSTVSPTPSGTATPVASSSSLSAAAAAVASLGAPASTIPISTTTSSTTPNTSQATVIFIPALPPTNTLSSNPRVHAATGSHFNILYLIPVFVVVGLALGALSGLLGYRWYSRRRARKGGPSNGRAGSSFVPGPPYIAMLDSSHDSEGARAASPTPVGSPSKYTRRGASRAARSWLSVVAGTGSRRGSTRSSSIPPSQRSTTRAATPSHLRPLSDSPTRARSRGSTTSPGSLSDEENVPYETIRHTSIRRGILERLQRGIDRGISRGPSRRTTQTYLSAPSAYSGTHTEDSRAPSAVPSPPRDTDWIPGSGFRIVEEAISSPPPSTAAISSPTSGSVAGLPGQTTTAWDDRAAIRQAVDAHPGERWLAWTRSWASSPPPAGMYDRFTAIPARREKWDVGAALPRSPPQLASDSLQSTLTFSPSLAPAVPGAATTTASRRACAQSKPPRPLARATRQTAAVRGDSRASSIALGEGHGTPAMRYAARQTALARVEDILARSYSSRDLAAASPASPGSPNAFGAAAVPTPSMALASTEEEEDVTLAAGIEQRLAVAATATNRRRQR
ncbi:hypothetical protein BJY52DRAFT_533086 [Lactarius psammicola]|nr:hypothetical protein BJY52DRAFT_533086 [Lactarius psammicola]